MKNNTAWAMWSGLPSRLTSVALMACRRSGSEHVGRKHHGAGQDAVDADIGVAEPSSTARQRVIELTAPLDRK